MNKAPRWLVSFLSQYKAKVALALALGLAASGCAALLMFTSGYLIAATAGDLATLFAVMTPIACVQLFGFGKPLAHYFERLASHDWVLRVTSDLRQKLFDAIAIRYRDPSKRRAAGEYLGLLSDDIAHLQNLYLRVVFPSAIALLLAFGASIAFGFFSIPFALVMALAFALLVFGLPWCSLLAVRTLQRELKTCSAAEYARITDDVMGATDWVLSGRSAQAVTQHADIDSKMRAISAHARLRIRLLSLASTLLMGAVACAVIIWATSEFQPLYPAVNWIVAFALGFFPLIEAFAMLPATFPETTNHEEAIVRLDEYLGRNPRESNHPACTGGIDVTEHGEVNARDLSYRYPGSPSPVLDRLSVSIAPGQHVALLGPSGAGKSTLAEVMRRSNPACVTLIGQTPYLFNRTLRENLTMGVMDASDERLLDALASVGLRGKVESLAYGLDTVIGETGIGFSGGEAHRIAVARAFLADKPVIVVDEPFSSLDPQTEKGLLDTLLHVFSDKTLIVITHHLAEIERFDRVIFIEGGVVTIDGTPGRLRQSSERFRRLLAFDRSA